MYIKTLRGTNAPENASTPNTMCAGAAAAAPASHTWAASCSACCPTGARACERVFHVRCDDDGGASKEPVHASALGVAGAAAVAAVAASGSSTSTSAAATITPKQQRAGAKGNRLC